MYFEDLDNLRQPALYYISGHEDPDGPWLILDWNGIPTDDDECRYDIISEHIRDRSDLEAANHHNHNLPNGHGDPSNQHNNISNQQDNLTNRHNNHDNHIDYNEHQSQQPLLIDHHQHQHQIKSNGCGKSPVIENNHQNNHTDLNNKAVVGDNNHDDDDDDDSNLCLLTVPPVIPNLANNRFNRQYNNIKNIKNQDHNNIHCKQKACIVKNEIFPLVTKQQRQQKQQKHKKHKTT